MDSKKSTFGYLFPLIGGLMEECEEPNTAPSTLEVEFMTQFKTIFCGLGLFCETLFQGLGLSRILLSH